MNCKGNLGWDWMCRTLNPLPAHQLSINVLSSIYMAVPRSFQAKQMCTSNIIAIVCLFILEGRMTITGQHSSFFMRPT